MISTHSESLFAWITRCTWITICISLAIACAGCSSSSTGPDGSGGATQTDWVLVDQLSASMVPNGQDTLVFEATDGSTCAAICSDDAVATLTVVDDSTVVVRGVALGTATVTITSTSGLVRQVPVTVYDPRVLDLGELELTWVDQFEERYRTMTFPLPDIDHYASFFDPREVLGGNFRSLGSCGWQDSNPPDVNPNGSETMLVVRAEPGSDALASPLEFTRVWDSRDSKILWTASFWEPVAPPGYRALGVVVDSGLGEPDPGAMVCVRKDLVYQGDAGSFVWNDDGDGGPPSRVGVWQIKRRDANPVGPSYLLPGTCVAWDSWTVPKQHACMNVLKVVLPALADGVAQDFVPRLTSTNAPPEETRPIKVWEVLIPFDLVKDEYYPNLHQRFVESPIYRLERQILYKKEFFLHNTGTVVEPGSVDMTTGITTSQTNTFWQSSGIEISVRAGVALPKGLASAEISATISRELGYSSSTGVAELTEKTITVPASTPPQKAKVIWQQYSRFVFKRHNGTVVEVVGDPLDIGMDNYLVDEYPD